MSRKMACVTCTIVWCMALALGALAPALANPLNYPEYAQQKVDPAISITFVGVDRAKEALDAGRPQLFVDVRSLDEYNATHLPKAVSIPLKDLAVRMAEVPRNSPVILY